MTKHDPFFEVRNVRIEKYTPRPITVELRFFPFKSLRERAQADAACECTALSEAEEHVICQVRGNGSYSDAKVQHICVSLLEEHFKLPRAPGNAYARLCALTLRADELGLRGRAVVAGLWMLRMPRGFVDDFDAWRLISDAREQEAST